MTPHLQGSRVAVVGAGIAGMGAAWSLHRAGAEVTVFERNPDIGGNAKTHAWDVGGREIVTGLSVLAWPEQYFQNYRCLLAELGVATEMAPPLRFFVKDGDRVYAHGLDSNGARAYADDVRRWERLVSFARKVNTKTSGKERPSLYDQTPTNPLHVVPLRALARTFGISRAFWQGVFVPIHSSSFLTVDLDLLPASIAPTIEDIVSIANGGTLRTWSGSSRDVFARLTRGFEERVHRDRGIARVERSSRGVLIEDASGRSERFDTVVFACNAMAVARMLSDASPLERMLLGGVKYPDADDPTFLEGIVHSDASVLPAEHRDAILSGFANYIERIDLGGGRARYENTFVLSSWVPTARGEKLPMLVSYNREKKPAGILRRVANDGAHPCFTPGNLARAWLLRRIQGKRSSYYCGSYATPGNGHDLSLLSGLVVAGAMGAPHPFEDPSAREDYALLRKFMLGRSDR